MDTLSARRTLAPSCLAAMLTVALAGCASARPPAVDADPAPRSMTVRGQLTAEGVECPALRAEDGTLYTLLGDLGGLKPGERVVVIGTPVEISFCMQGTTLQVTRITRQ